MLELLPCPNTIWRFADEVPTLLCCLRGCLADGAIATGTLSFTTRYFQESSNRNFMVVGRHANFLLTTRMPFGFALLGCFSAPSLSDEIPTLLLHHSEAHYAIHLGLLVMCFTMVHRRGFEPTLATLKGW